MEWLQTLLDNSTTPVLTAFLLGLLNAISPCPLATNIAAIGYIGKDVSIRRNVFIRGLLYTLGRTATYTLLGIALILILRRGASLFGIQRFVATWGERMIGPLLVIVGLLMLVGNRLNLPKFGIKGNGEGLAKKGGIGAFLLGMLFALAFCPTSGLFYFGMLIPMSAAARGGYLLPVVFAVATALPVIAVAWLLAYSVNKVARFYGRMKALERWTSVVVGVMFILIGIYECIINFI